MQISTGPIGSIDKYKPVHIYGAGVSGLLLAYFLKKHQYEVKIFEKKSYVGGKISTELTPNGPIEFAANAIFTNEDVIDLLDELGIEYITATEKLKKKIFREGKIFEKPLRFFEIIKVLFKLFRRPPKLTQNLTLYEFFRPLLGENLCKDVLDAALVGIYATSSTELNFISIFKNYKNKSTYLQFLLDLKKNKTSKTKAQSISFKNGMNEFIQKLESKLKANIEYNSEKTLCNMANNIICTEAYNAAVLTENDYPSLSNLLKEISYIPLQTSTFILTKKIDFLENSFGIVFSKSNHPFLRGVLHNSEIFEGRTSGKAQYSYTFITEPLKEAKLDIEEELKELFKIDISNSIAEFRTKKWDRALPKYGNERALLISKLRTEIYSYPAGIVLFGNYIDGISIREMITQAKTFAEK